MIWQAVLWRFGHKHTGREELTLTHPDIRTRKYTPLKLLSIILLCKLARAMRERPQHDPPARSGSMG
ncbi:hypothetical protein CKO32_17785 [Afifella marina DSM 2698]|uniref:Uncharacterized protein n=1 Tax=Afifella marina DSM 2698 TaxID=1120955 RepID=A0A1G5PBF0_AFIMA|nr:hypothetical protein [Afifella marina DSM 2698]MBK1629032.1 hypothetical protein [Afifella marina]MBK5918008.1 hypothetical protein [Afifella marina]RAI17563.1 hypothetical protein CH311_17970 [Afifella marina DSM 2698]SCZ46340.1 hypothetical protein SAMN03080610_03635 [Afifella marina DSM 2698]